LDSRILFVERVIATRDSYHHLMADSPLRSQQEEWKASVLDFGKVLLNALELDDELCSAEVYPRLFRTFADYVVVSHTVLPPASRINLPL
jgi:hypothetical protein